VRTACEARIPNSRLIQEPKKTSLRWQFGETECPVMMFVLKIIGLWVLLSSTLAPCLTWLFFYGKRQREQTKARRGLIDIPSSGQASYSS
jgi:hypothetical protein